MNSRKSKMKKNRGALTIEASIAYPIFLTVIVSMLYIMRIVYTYGLVQHAVSQTAKELSMYTYIYQITGMHETGEDIQSSVEDRTETFNEDVGNVVELYESFSSGNFGGSYDGTVNPLEILKNIGSAMFGEVSKEVNEQFFQAVVKPLMKGYIGADANGNSADERLKALRVIGGFEGLDFSSSHFFEDGATVDIVVCYTIEPLFLDNIMPEMNLVNRAAVRGMSGKTVFSRTPADNEEDNKKDENEEEQEEYSIWDNPDITDVQRGKLIQEQSGIRNLPGNFPAFTAFHSSTGKAVAEMSMDLRKYQDAGKIAGQIRKQCSNMENYRTTTNSGVTVKKEDIRKKELIVYIPSSKDGREINYSEYEEAIQDVRDAYPDIKIVTKKID